MYALCRDGCSTIHSIIALVQVSATLIGNLAVYESASKHIVNRFTSDLRSIFIRCELSLSVLHCECPGEKGWVCCFGALYQFQCMPSVLYCCAHSLCTYTKHRKGGVSSCGKQTTEMHRYDGDMIPPIGHMLLVFNEYLFNI